MLAGATTCAKLAASEGAFQPVHDPTPPAAGSSFDAYDAYLIKVAADGSGPLFSTFLGGSKYDRITAVAVAPDDSIVLVGSTASPNLPVTPDALQPRYAGGDLRSDPNGDGFIARISSSGDRLLYSSYLGSSSRDSLSAVSVDAAGTAYLGGNSPGSPLVTPGSARVAGAAGGSDLVVKYGNDSRPAPVLDAASPASVEAGSSELTITLSGNGFAESAQALWNGGTRPTAFVTSSQLTVTFSAADLALTGDATLRVVNPGSGVSNPIAFPIVTRAGENPNPRIDTIVPTSALTGSAGFGISIRGSGFTSPVSALWNGLPRPTRFISAEELQFDLTADDLAQPGTAEIAVEAAAPGGGRSNNATFVVAGVIPPNPPTLLSVAPSVVNAGSPATSFRIGAYALTPSAVLRFNGVDHPIYKHGDLDGPIADISAAELARPGMARVTVYDPSTRRESNPLNVWIPLNLPSTSVAYSAFTKRVYIAAKDSAKGIVVFDPAAGQVEGNFPLQAVAAKVGVSSDGKLLYAMVPTQSGSALRRYALRNGAPWLEGMMQLPPQGVTDFEPIPGKPASVAVIADGLLAVFDGVVARPGTAQIGQDPGGLAFSDDGSTLYIFSESGGLRLQYAQLSDAGVGSMISRGDYAYSGKYPVTQFGGRLYTPSGRVYEANTLRLVGSVPIAGYAAPLVTPSAMIWVAGNQYYCLLAAFDPASFAPLWETHTQPGCDGNFVAFSSLIDADGRILFRMTDRIFLLRPPPSAPGYSVVPEQDFVRRTLELGTLEGLVPKVAVMSGQERLPLTAFVSEGGFVFSNTDPRFVTTITPFRLPLFPNAAPDIAIGPHAGAIYLLLSGASNAPVRVPYEFEIVDTYPLRASVSSLSFMYKPGDPAPAPQSFALTKDGGPLAVNLRIVPPVSWLQFRNSDNTAPETITVTVFPGSLAPGTYTSSLEIQYYGKSTQQMTIPITLTIGN